MPQQVSRASGSARVMLFVALTVLVAVAPGCSSTGSNELSCDVREVSPADQQGSDDGEGALEAYLETQADVESIPESGYELSSSSDSKEIYTAAEVRVAVGSLGSPEDDDKFWVVLQIFDCSG